MLKSKLRWRLIEESALRVARFGGDLLGRNDPLIWPAAAEFVKRVVPTSPVALFRRRPLRARRERQRDRRRDHRDVLAIGPTRG